MGSCDYKGPSKMEVGRVRGDGVTAEDGGQWTTQWSLLASAEGIRDLTLKDYFRVWPSELQDNKYVFFKSLSLQSFVVLTVGNEYICP